MQDLANNSGTIKALLLNHSRRSAVEGPLSKERRSSEVRRRRASLLVIDNLVPLQSLALHVRMDNDFLYDMGLHLGAYLPTTISVGWKQRPGEIMANTAKRANPPCHPSVG